MMKKRTFSRLGYGRKVEKIEQLGRSVYYTNYGNGRRSTTETIEEQTKTYPGRRTESSESMELLQKIC
ncbi:uncharacterized protein LOC143344950 isoform X2 [Colletes latitarsis]|uniref:uncharacterized protein LOC143344950 isoform X2 n=1 Tax=Colletes latitarsis TaxID=2605962 RepID=UPI0040372C26